VKILSAPEESDVDVVTTKRYLPLINVYKQTFQINAEKIVIGTRKS
jgi:hypothetical protein